MWGRDKVPALFRELERAAYLTAYPAARCHGRWIWDYAFRPTSLISTIDALSVVDRPSRFNLDGKASI